MKEKISIITCCYNSEKTFIDTIKSIEKIFISKYKDRFEFIVIDSSDTNKIKLIVDKFNFESFYYYLPRSGIYDAMNYGAQKASGKYFWFLNSDDWINWENTSLDTIIDFVNLDLPIFFGKVSWVDKNKKYITGTTGFNPFYKISHLACFPPHPATLVKSDLFMRNNGFNKNYSISADYAKFLEIVNYKNLTINRNYFCCNFVVFMREGGVSSSFKAQFTKIIEDRHALKLYNFPIINLILKRLCRGYFSIERRRLYKQPKL